MNRSFRLFSTLKKTHLVSLLLAAVAIVAVFMLAPPAQSACDPSYPTVCIVPAPPDLDCKDISYRYFPVLPPDPHHFDGGRDRQANGIGCEIPPAQP